MHQERSESVHRFSHDEHHNLIESPPSIPIRPPPVPATAPLPVVLAPGKSYWACTCGQSKKWPHCDGSHKAFNEANGTDFKSHEVKNETEEDKTFYICACGHSQKRPFCDGSHRKLREVGAEAATV